MALTVDVPCGVVPVTTAGVVAGNPDPPIPTNVLPKGLALSCGVEGPPPDGGPGAVVPQAATTTMPRRNAQV